MKSGTAQSTIATETGAGSEKRAMLASLYELIDALDRRVPRLERVGEAQIAHDATELRDRAFTLIRRMEAHTPVRASDSN